MTNPIPSTQTQAASLRHSPKVCCAQYLFSCLQYTASTRRLIEAVVSDEDCKRSRVSRNRNRLPMHWLEENVFIEAIPLAQRATWPAKITSRWIAPGSGLRPTPRASRPNAAGMPMQRRYPQRGSQMAPNTLFAQRRQNKRLCHLNVLVPSARRASASSPETRASTWLAARRQNFINTNR